MNKLNIQIIIILLLLSTAGMAQTLNLAIDTPVVGKPCPSFTLKNIQHFNKKEASLKDFNGKWLVLDFWSLYCSGCIASFPKMDSLRKEFSNDVEVMLVGLPYNDGIESFFKRLSSKLNLALPVSYDTSLFKRFGGDGLPYVIVIDPKGIVRAVTYGLNKENFQQMVNGKALTVRAYMRRIGKVQPAPIVDSMIPLKNDRYLYQAVFYKWKAPMPISYNIISNNRLDLTGFDISSLYKLAYFGQSYWNYYGNRLYGKVAFDPILDVNDSTKLIRRSSMNNSDLYGFSVVLPKSGILPYYERNKNLQNLLKESLKMAFPYKAHIEIREFPAYRITISDYKLFSILKTEAGVKVYDPSKFGYRQGLYAKNIPLKMLISHIKTLPGIQNDFPLIDQTNYHGNINITLKSVTFQDAIRTLKRMGISIDIINKKMKVLVITDENKTIKD